MRLWQKITQHFNWSSQLQPEDKVIRTQKDVQKAFVRQVKNHCDRLRSQSPSAAEELKVLAESTVKHLSEKAAEKMWLTIEDNEHHSFSISRGTVLYQVSTLSCDLSEVSTIYRKDHGGYINFLTKLFNHLISTGTGFQTFCHILFGLNHRGSWVQVGVLPIPNTKTKKNKAGVMPIDILNNDERSALPPTECI